MTNSTWKFAIAAVLASSGFLAFACGGGEAEGGGATTPSATQASTGTPPATATETGATATATATATTPPAPTLPASFTTADDTRKTADAAWTAIVTDAKETKCDVFATKVAKFQKDNEAAYSAWNGEFSKLSDDQKKLVKSSAPAADTSTATAGFKACVDKKDKKLMAAVAAADASMKKMPGAAAPAGSGSAAPATSGSAKPPAKK